MSCRLAVASLGAVSALVLRPWTAFAEPAPEQSPRTCSSGSDAYFKRSSYADAYEMVSPAVVNIQCSSSNHFPFIRGVSCGSGFIITDSGRIVTNCHVVQHCQTAPVITLGDNQQFLANVVGVDEATDLALLQIVPLEGKQDPFPLAKLGDSDNVKPGTLVLALGSPLSLQKTATHGMISAIERQSGELGLSASHRTDFIQTDAPINVGNSGGPLIDLDGFVIGVATMRAENALGISFAVPIKTVKAVVEQLNQYGRVIRPYIGIYLLTLTPSIIAKERRADPNFPDIKNGVLVTSVSPISPAGRSGLQPGDVIVSVDADIPIKSGQALMDYLGFDNKRSIVLHVLRGRHKLDIRIDPEVPKHS